MKKFLRSKAVAIVLSCLLLVGVFVGVSVWANNAPTIEITAANLKHDGQVKLAYSITADGASVDESKMFLYMWGRYPTDSMLDTPQQNSSVSCSDAGDGTYVAYSRGFAPAEMTQVVFAQVVYLDDDENVVSRSNIVRYSVFEHICRINTDPAATETETALYTSLEDYITYAQKYLNWTKNSSPDELCYVNITGGTILPQDGSTNSYTHGVYLGGSSITISADCDENALSYWLCNDAVVSGGTSMEVSLQGGSDYNYRAVTKSYVKVSGVNADNITVENATAATGGTLTGASVTDNGYAVSTRYVKLTAPKWLDDNDTVFTGWYNASGKCLSTSLSYIFNPNISSGNVETGAQTHTITADYQNYEESYWTAVKNAGCDDATLAALKDLNDYYDGTATITWMANLWDPNVGGFYYANSSRDYTGFLPDLESTNQLTNWLKGNGATSLDRNKFLPHDMKKKIVEFAKSLQNEDGYFYHTQWPQGIENLQNDRYSRDLDWAVALITGLKYDTTGDGVDDDQWPNYCTPEGTRCATYHKEESCSCSAAASTVAAVTTGFAGAASDAPVALTVSLRQTSTGAARKVQCANVSAVAETTVSSNPDFSSEAAFVEWLYAYSGVSQTYDKDNILATDLLTNSGKAHNLNAMKTQIVNKGYGDEVIDFLYDMQARTWNYMVAQGQTPTGVWQTATDNKKAVWGILKYMPYFNDDTVGKNVGDNAGITIAADYDIGIKIGSTDITDLKMSDGTAIPKGLVVSLAMIYTAIKAIELDPNPDWALNDMMNQWNCMSGVISNIYKYYGEEGRTLARSLIKTNITAMVENTIKKLKYYRLSDGTFAYMYYIDAEGKTVPYAMEKIYGVPISMGLSEADVNGNSLICTMYRSIFTLLGYTAVPLCNETDGQLFLEIVGGITDVADKNSATLYERTFEDDYGYQLSSYVNTSNGTNQTPTFGIVNNPTDSSDKVYRFNSIPDMSASSRGGASVSFNTTGNNVCEPGNCFIFESDIYLGSSTTTSDRESLQIWIGDMFMLSLGLSGSTVHVGYRVDTSNHGGQVTSFTNNGWFKLRLEIYNDGGTQRVKYFVDDEYVGTVEGMHYGQYTGKAFDTDIKTVRFSQRRDYVVDLYLDNCYFNMEEHAYTAGTTKIKDYRG